MHPRGVIGLVAAAVVLAGCGHASDSPKSPSTPTLFTVAPTPTPLKPTAPVLPDAAKADTKAGAVAFVRHYVEVLNYAQATGEVADVVSLGESGCDSCTSVAEGLRVIYRSGGTIKGGSWTFRRLIGAQPNHQTRNWSISALVSYEAQKIVGGKHPDQSEKGIYSVTFTVVWKTNNWRISQWSRIG